MEKNVAQGKAEKMLKELVTDKFRKMASPKSLPAHRAVSMLKEASSSSLSESRLNHLISSIEKYIYGNTPMCEALSSAYSLYADNREDRNILFILTDGEATDGDPKKYAEKFKSKNVIFFTCLLTSKNIPEPRCLYYKPDPRCKAQKDMFQLSSEIENTEPVLGALLERGWKLPEEGRSRLFIQANNPQLIEEFSSLARSLLKRNDALLNIAARMELDIYINSKISSFKPNSQIGGTCYANAVAAVFHLAMRRIEGRENGVPNFAALLREIISAFGENGAALEQVFDKYCPKYRLHYNPVDESNARQAINARRPAIAAFCLTDKQWKKFGTFYKTTPQGILTAKDVGERIHGEKLEGHAVVLIKCGPECLTFMNSWGTGWGDGGFFKVQNASVLGLIFYDVYWTLQDLTYKEKDAYEKKVQQGGINMAKELPDRLKNLLYKCPMCKKDSAACQFKGNFYEAKCPKCNKTFKPVPLGLNIFS